MKLDSIIYDKDTLASTLTQQWLTDSPMFTSMYPSETTTALVNVFAAYGAMIQYCLISAMANCYTDSAFSDRGIYQLAVTLGNSIHGNNSSTVRVKMTKNSLIGVDTNIPAGTQFKINDKLFFNPKEIAFPASLDTVSDIVLLQGERLQANFVTTGTPAERFYFASDFKCNTNQVSVTVNNEVWSVSDSFLDYDKSYITSDKEMNVVVLRTDADGRSYIKLGNNQLGNLPPAGSTVQVTYISNDGSNGNIGEIDAEGKLTSELIYTDGNGNQKNLDVTISTLTTAYGGFDTQSIESLRYTSPYVFASGHRAIRRQDYRAILQSQCGYITSNVWGEYEEAKAAGTYDAIMMNMVYYSGLKSFVNYPFSNIGDINNKSKFTGTIGSTKGLLGSHVIKFMDKTNESKYVLMQDNHGKGLLFINDNSADKRDSILPIWKLTTQNDKVYEYEINKITNPGQNYKVNDILNIVGTSLSMKIDSVGDLGEVLEAHLTKKYSTAQLNGEYSSVASSTSTGTDLSVSLRELGYYGKNFITSSNTDSTEADTHPISYAMSDEDEAKYFQSNYEPTLLKPVQIKFNFLEVNGKSIAAIKFKSSPANDSPFMGSFALFGTNVPDASYENVRNSSKWERIIDKTEVNNPYVEKGSDWTDWYPTNVYTKNSNGNYEFTQYSKYVLEIYSPDSSSASISNVISIGKIKVLYSSEASTIEYDNNGNLNLKMPSQGDPGVGDSDGYLTADLFNTTEYSMFKYTLTPNNIKTSYWQDGKTIQGYSNGQTLIATPEKGDVINDRYFIIKILDIDNQKFDIKYNQSEALTGNEKLNSKDMNISLYLLCTLDFNKTKGQIKDAETIIGKKESNTKRTLAYKTVTEKMYSGTYTYKIVIGYVVEGSETEIIGLGNTVIGKVGKSKPIVYDSTNSMAIGYMNEDNKAYTFQNVLLGEKDGDTNDIKSNNSKVAVVNPLDVKTLAISNDNVVIGHIQNKKVLAFNTGTEIGSIQPNKRVIGLEGKDIGKVNAKNEVLDENDNKIGLVSDVEEIIALDNDGYFMGYVRNKLVISPENIYSKNRFSLPSDSTLFPTIGRIVDTDKITNANNCGTGYKVGDELWVDRTASFFERDKYCNPKPAILIVKQVDENGAIQQLEWKDNQPIVFRTFTQMIYQKDKTILIGLNKLHSGTGNGAYIKLTLDAPTIENGTTLLPGYFSLESESNLGVDVSFKGNKIDTQDINYLDQPIMDKYNHFTTYLEFKQPEVEQIDIMLKVSLSANAYITSDMIKQEITNNVTKLFELKPDSMCKGLKISDIYTAVMKTPNVNWCKVMKPTDNINASRNTVMVLSNLTIREVIEEK